MPWPGSVSFLSRRPDGSDRRANRSCVRRFSARKDAEASRRVGSPFDRHAQFGKVPRVPLPPVRGSYRRTVSYRRAHFPQRDQGSAFNLGSVGDNMLAHEFRNSSSDPFLYRTFNRIA